MVFGFMADVPDKRQQELGTIRDTVESIWVAIVLAFVLRAFMFEAFVIPTGSMAPRLVGEHWDLVCPACHYDYAYGLIGGEAPRSRARKLPPGDARCPNCGFPFAAGSERTRYVNGGDRVLVLKYLYNFRSPRPWDVIVFRNPQNNQENYIKRLVGLPGETIEIVHGDVYVKQPGEEDWRIRRKTRRQVREALWHVVYDNDYPPNGEMIEAYNASRSPAEQIRPPQWRVVGAEPGEDDADGALRGRGWDLTGQNGRRFAFDAADEAVVRLDAQRRAFGVRYGYNPTARNNGVPDRRQEDICSDLKLSLSFTPDGPDSRLWMSLSAMHVPHEPEARQRLHDLGAAFEQDFRAEIRADGQIRLLRRAAPQDEWRTLAEGRVPALKPGRGYELALSHADYRVTFWFEGEPVLRTTDDQYAPHVGAIKAHLADMRRAMQGGGPLSDDQQQRYGTLRHRPLLSEAESVEFERLRRAITRFCEQWVPTPKVRIGAADGPCALTHVRLQRDVYYTEQSIQGPKDGGHGELLRYAEKLGAADGRTGWGCFGNPITLHDYENDDLDEFYVLGDNSPQSMDSRAWLSAAPTLRLWRKDRRVLHAHADGAEPIYTLGTVPRYNLIGRAFFVYWPAGFRIPGLPGLSPIPNVGRMRLVR